MSAALLPPGLSCLVLSQHWESTELQLHLCNYGPFRTALLPKPGDAFLSVKFAGHQNVFFHGGQELSADQLGS